MSEYLSNQELHQLTGYARTTSNCAAQIPRNTHSSKTVPESLSRASTFKAGWKAGKPWPAMA